MLADIYFYALQNTQYLSLDGIRNLQERKLKYLIGRVQSWAPFYREYLKGARNLEDFSSLDPLSKAEMRVAFEKGENFNKVLLSYGIPQYTSGSTGIPFYFFLDMNMLSHRVAMYRRMLQWSGREKHDFVVSLMPRIHPGLEQENFFFRCNNPSEIDKKLPELLKLLEGKSVILQTRTSHLIRLAQLLEREKKDFSFKALISYTEQLFPEVRSYLTKVFGAPIFNYYACNEITAIGQECEMHDGFHVNSEWVLVEIVDDEQRPVPPGVAGNILVTSLTNEVMPFLKYKIGDRGEWLKEPCPCGRTLPRIKIEGRGTQTFRLPNGRMGYFASFVRPLASLVKKIRQYQVIRHSPMKFEVMIIPTQIFIPEDGKSILNNLRLYLGKDAEVILSLVDEIKYAPGGKERAFIDLASGK